MNTVNIIGTLTRDCELKYTQGGSAIGSFGIALNEKWKDKSGQLQEKAMFFDVTAFGKRAEVISNHFKKGDKIGITGSLDYQSWDAQDGTKRSKVSIKLNDFDFIGSKNNTPQQNNDQATQHTANHTTQQQQVPVIEIENEDLPF